MTLERLDDLDKQSSFSLPPVFHVFESDLEIVSIIEKLFSLGDQAQQALQQNDSKRVAELRAQFDQIIDGLDTGDELHNHPLLSPFEQYSVSGVGLIRHMIGEAVGGKPERLPPKIQPRGVGDRSGIK